MGPGQEDLGPPGGPADLHHIDLQAVALVDGFPPDLLTGGQEGVGVLAAGADAEAGRPVPGVDAGHHAGEDLVLLGAELVVDHAPLRLTDALDDDLPGGLGGDAAEVPGLDLDADHVPQLGVGDGAPGLLQGDLGGGIVHALHDVLEDEHPHLAGLGVGLDLDVVPGPLVVPLVGGGQGLGDLLHHIAGGDALFLLDLGNGGEELLAGVLSAVGFFRIFSRHSSILSLISITGGPCRAPSHVS